jgi:predicted acylesterase/phospholipase RssA
MARKCDIVMKGGITSGVVYPAAVVEIAKTFTFSNVGGTSAGAIAASLTAAAERRRARDGTMAGFDRIGAIPEWLATDNRLFGLFVPNAGTRSLFRTIVSLLGRPRFQPVFLAKLCGLIWAFPIASVLGALCGVAFLVTVIRTTDITAPWLFWVAILLASMTVIAGMGLAVGIALFRDVLGRLPHNFYGLVTGIDDADRASEIALCTWLASELELTAGLDPGKIPLSFGMLWDAKRAPTLTGLDKMPAEPDVNLEMITTNASWGRPYAFPVTVESFFFDPTELRRFFPDYVVDWMVKRKRAPRDDREAGHFKSYEPRLPLPLPGDLPVLFATRMSLAFPILLSAVPLWAPDYAWPLAKDANPKLERCWFSDGGISSNFPVTLFDSPLPRWPTFAINLAPFPAWRKRDPDDESKNVYMPATNDAARLLPFITSTGVPGFLSAIANAMQNWNDNTQSILPGYRDRIVTVFLDSDEGGLNLDMPPAILARLRARGAAAGALIAGRFEAPSVLGLETSEMNWENHRWLRFRSTMGALRDYLTHFKRAMAEPELPDVPYDALICATDGLPTRRYPLETADRAAVLLVTHELTKVGTTIESLPGIDKDLPQPSPQLVVRGSQQS